MSTPLRLLIVEDSEDDALLLLRELRRADYAVTFERVETAESMALALAKQNWDLVIADHNMPQFNGIAALELCNTNGADVPFILVSGSIGEDLAVAAMKAGAQDYLMKGSLSRLIPSVQRELREANVRRERKRAEEALQVSEARNGAILEAALDSIITMDHEGKIVEFNPAAEKTFGYKRQEIIGQLLADLIIPPSLREQHRRGLAHYLATGEGPVLNRRIELTAVRSDETEFPVELAVSRIHGGGAPIFTAYIRDLTEQKAQETMQRRSHELEEQNRLIQEANRLKNEFFANMSHELRTPLNAIIGFSQILVDGKAGPLQANQREYIDDILTSGQHLLQLINDVLDLAKIEAGKLELDIATFSCAKAVEEVCTVMRPIAAKRNIRINPRLPSNLGMVTLDERRFKQALYNLISNAVKFSHENGEVEVVVQTGMDDKIRLQVKDFGIGIKREDLPRLFREFEQLDSGSARRHQGTGLGLALTKKIVELHKGFIAVESELGKGSIFEIVLPISP